MFFFFKQKTAYELRISDWSSDVCSSDLSQNERYLQRQSSSLPELRNYYDAITPRLNEIFDHLDKFALESLPEPEALLFRTALGLTEVGMAVEVFGQAGVPHVPLPHKMDVQWNQ